MIEVVEVPRLKAYTRLLVGLLEGESFDRLFLPLPRGLEERFVESLLSGRDPSELLGSETGFPPKAYSHLSPLYEYLRSSAARGGPELVFYKSRRSVEGALRFAREAVALLALAVVADDVPTERWLRLLSRAGESVREDAEFIALRAEGRSLVVCQWGSRLAEELKRKGADVRKARLAPYVPLPLESLAALKSPSPGDVERLVRDHARFVSRYLLLSRDLDEAYLAWLLGEKPQGYEEVLALVRRRAEGLG